ncbi:hypothetical protein AMJ39_06540 [candidate division TA06 bacterium DG_24]|uniref:FlgD/Vpr Ig-like domain-containing protein n=1 Tax=candidate division TA06 bacterium DG_24 TaxID=1703770 RepID=A0A0S7WS29_UNCT6|nr:MAG: hypothetical protein AMJ39_06540 [candidate division TA06 bacterium DG_24]
MARADGTCIFWIVLVVLLAPLSAGAQFTFERTYGGPEWDEGFWIEETIDGGYIIAGRTASFSVGGDDDVYLIKIDAAGDTVWTRSYGGAGDDRGSSVAQTSDGGYIIAGGTDSFGEGGDLYLIKTDASGDTVWTRTYGGPAWDSGHSVEQTGDAGYIVAGESHSFGAGSDDVYLVKTDGAGDTIWTHAYGGTEWDCGYSVYPTGDRGYILAGWSLSFGAGARDIYLIKTDPAGDTIWTRTYGGLDWESGYSVAQTVDGGYIIAGGTDSYGAGNHDVYVIKTNATGDTSWTHTYGGIDSDYGYSVAQTADGGYVIAGYTTSFGEGGADVYLIKTDAAGDTVWTRTYGGADWDWGYLVTQAGDGGYVIAGWSESFGAGGHDVYLIKTDADGLVHVSGGYGEEPRPGLRYLGQNSPNPFRAMTTIRYALPDARWVTLSIYDVRGALVRRLISGTVSAGAHQVMWDGRDGRGREVASGIYFYHLEAGEQSETKRMVLVR